MGRQRARVGFPRAHTLLFFPRFLQFWQEPLQAFSSQHGAAAAGAALAPLPGGRGFCPRNGTNPRDPSTPPSFLIFFFLKSNANEHHEAKTGPLSMWLRGCSPGSLTPSSQLKYIRRRAINMCKYRGTNLIPRSASPARLRSLTPPSGCGGPRQRQREGSSRGGLTPRLLRPGTALSACSRAPRVGALNRAEATARRRIYEVGWGSRCLSVPGG